MVRTYSQVVQNIEEKPTYSQVVQNIEEKPKTEMFYFPLEIWILFWKKLFSSSVLNELKYAYRWVLKRYSSKNYFIDTSKELDIFKYIST